MGREEGPRSERDHPLEGPQVGVHVALWRIDDDGRQRRQQVAGDEHEVVLPLGARPIVEDGQEVEPGVPLVEWDPFTSSILTAIKGKVKFHDLVEGENVREEIDKLTGHAHKIVIEPLGSGKRIPTIVIEGDDGEVASLVTTDPSPSAIQTAGVMGFSTALSGVFGGKPLLLAFDDFQYEIELCEN